MGKKSGYKSSMGTNWALG